MAEATQAKAQSAKNTARAGATNPMRQVLVSKITMNVGAGKNEKMLVKGVKLLSTLCPQVKPVQTKTTKRIPGFGLRPGLAIGVKSTVRSSKGALALLKRLLEAKEFTLSLKSFDAQGNFSFGIAEYIDIPGMEYDPELKVMGLEVAVTLERPGFRVARRKLYSRKLGKSQKVSREDAVAFAREVLGATVE